VYLNHLHYLFLYYIILYINQVLYFIDINLAMKNDQIHNVSQEDKFDFSKVDTVTKTLKVLANPDRLKILCILIEKELNVQSIESHTNIQQPTLSQQLTVLRNAEIVKTRREGKQIYYQIKDNDILKIMQTLYEIYCEPNE
jgi:DNA-binding transcriptional ArsR family regulator